MKKLKTLVVIAVIMVGISNSNGAYVISSFKELIPEITSGYAISMGMDYNPVVDNLMVRDPNTGVDSIVSNIGLWHFGGYKIVPEGIIFGLYFDNHIGGVVHDPPYTGYLVGAVYEQIFAAGETVDGVMGVYDPDGGGFGYTEYGVLSFDDNIVLYWTEDIEFDGVQGDLGSFGAIVYDSGGIRIPHMVINPVTASDPFPSDGDVDIELDVELSWTGAYGAVHNVYFGTDPDNLPEVSFEQTESVFDVEGLEWATAYYWRIDEVDGGGVISPGRVWTFDTINDCSSSIAGDVNSDCIVDLRDLATMAGNWLDCTRLGRGACP